jgi:tetratricopeptide (TPR) repeat protein
MELCIEEITEKKAPTICLNMIVRDEAHIIEKTLTNICNNIPITHWVICDTGSLDNTKELISQFFNKKNIEGEMYDDEWKDFGHNRSLALTKAFGKTDYLLIFDADDYIHGDLVLPSLDKDSYLFKFGSSFTYNRPLLINNRKHWKFIGVLHEYISCEDNIREEQIDGDYYVESGKLGGRHKDPQMLIKDAVILEDAFHKEKNENNIGLARRYAFYCGQSYRDAGLWEKSIKYYKERVKFKGWGEEVFYSYYQIGIGYMALNDHAKAKEAFLDGYEAYPQRSETLYELCKYYRIKGQCELANLYFSLGHQIPCSRNSLFCNVDIYNYMYDYEFFVFYYYLKNIKL